MNILKILLLSHEGSLMALQAGFMRCKAYKIMFKPETVQGLPLLQLLFQLIHRLLQLFNGTDTHFSACLMVSLAQASAKVCSSLASSSSF
jgi:hypothetical protein